MKEYDRYLQGEYKGWLHDRDGALAAVLLLDQFPRMMFRSTPKAFATDAMASAIAYKKATNATNWQ